MTASCAAVIPFPAIRYSFGCGTRDVQPEQRSAASFTELANTLFDVRNPSPPQDPLALKSWKANAPIYWFAQPMGGNGHRNAANAKPWPLLVLDIDGVRSNDPTTSPAEMLRHLVAALRQHASCFGWLTASHTDELPRARMVIHLDRCVAADESRRLTRILCEELTHELGVEIGSTPGAMITIDPSMQDPAHIAFTTLEGASRIGYCDAAGPLPVDDWLERSQPPNALPERVFVGASWDGGSGRPCTPPAIAELSDALRRLDQRNPVAVHDRSTWLRVLMAIKAHDWPETIVEPIARAWSEQSSKFDPERWPVDWASLKAEGPITPATLYHLAGPSKSRPDYASDDGLADLFIMALDGRAMYARGRWYWWNQASWEPDGGRVAFELKIHARVQADNCAASFHADPLDKRKEKQASSARALLNQPIQDRVMRSAAIKLRVPDADLDRDPMLLACINGTVDLRTGKLRPADPLDYITRSTGHAYDPDAPTPRWEAFIAEALGHTDSAEWCQRWLGYCTTGDNSEEKMVLALGPGGTGKSTMIKAVMHALGGEVASTSYAVAAPSALLSDTGRRSANEHTGGLTPLVGKRLAVVNEVKLGEAWDDSLFKQQVSREPIQMREVGGAHAFAVVPTWKLMVRGNHRPHVRDVSDAFYRRVVILEFRHRPEQFDTSLDAALASEASGILAWMVRGTQAWLRNGLTLPPILREALQSYRAEQDLVGEWVASNTEPGGFTDGAALRSDCEGYTGQKISPRAFAQAMRERGFEPTKEGGVRGFRLTLTPLDLA